MSKAKVMFILMFQIFSYVTVKSSFSSMKFHEMTLKSLLDHHLNHHLNHHEITMKSLLDHREVTVKSPLSHP